jgi:tetratricopeptide (TPR) repeat protein
MCIAMLLGRTARPAVSAGLLALFASAAAVSGCSGPTSKGQTRPLDASAAHDASASKAPTKKPSANPVLTPEQLEEAESNYQSGIEDIAQNHLVDAVNHFEAVYKMAPRYKNVSSQLQQAYLYLGMEHYTEGKPEEAIDMWNKVLQLNPKHEKALAYIRKTKQEIERIRELPGEKQEP